MAAGVWRRVQAGPDGLELLAYGGPVTGEDDSQIKWAGDLSPEAQWPDETTADARGPFSRTGGRTDRR